MIEKMKRRGAALLEEEEGQLVKVIVHEINAPAGPQKPTAPVEAPKEEVKDKKKKNKKRKNKGIDAFMEDASEAQAYQEQEAEVPKKKKKSVNFNLDNNQVKEFDKTKKIVETEE
jgi:hypothetical protein